MTKKYLYIISLISFLLIIPFATFAQEDIGIVMGDSAGTTDVLRFGSNITINQEISRDIIAGGGTITINEPG